MSVQPGAALRKDMDARSEAALGSEPLARAKDTVAEFAERVEGAATEAAEHLHRVYRRSGRKVARQVLRRPLHALLIAAAAGFVVGLVTN